MIIRFAIGITGIILGILIMRLITYREICNLKDQVIEIEERNDSIIKINAELKKQNARLKYQLSELYEDQNTPDFEDW